MFVHFQERTARMQVMVDPSAIQIAVGVVTILALGGGGSTVLFNILRTDLKETNRKLEGRFTSIENKLTSLENNVEGHISGIINSQKKVAKKIRKAFEDDDD